MSRQLEIVRLGAQGDGVADTGAGPVFVPFALPGEIVTVREVNRRTVLESIDKAAPERAKPACAHFGTCGGCSLQHLAASSYLEFKRNRIATALRQAGIGLEPEPVVACDPGTRRRAVFSARNTASGTVLGFNEAASHTILDIRECPVLAPEIVGALPKLRRLAVLFGTTAKPMRMTVTATSAGLDIGVSDAGRTAGNARRDLSALAIELRFARLSNDGEIIVEPVKPVVAFGETVVSPPPGGFLQAAEKAETAMADLVCDHLAKSKRVIDLFAGCGTFALRLARRSTVHAVEQDAAALAALDIGFRFGKGLKTVTHERRDLFRRPVTVLELKKYDGLVFDPPRAGAEDQARAIAKSAIRRVAAVSCNPATLARDLAILIAGGYKLKSVTPIDQFLWSPHVEAVALLEQ